MSGDPADSGGVGALVPVDEIGALETEIADRGSGYWRGPAAETKQSRYRDLLEAKAAGKTAPPSDAQLAERHRIETMIADKGSEYRRGRQVDGETALQRRYRQLLEGGDLAATTGADAWRASPGDAKANLPPAVVAAWGEEFNGSLKLAQDRAAIVAGALDREEFALLSSSFEGLSTNVQAAIYSELGAPSASGFAREANAADLALFESANPGASELVKIWGQSAARRAGIVMDMGQRIDAKLSSAEKEQLLYWWTASPPRERQLMLFAMGQSA